MKTAISTHAIQRWIDRVPDRRYSPFFFSHYRTLPVTPGGYSDIAWPVEAGALARFEIQKWLDRGEFVSPFGIGGIYEGTAWIAVIRHNVVVTVVSSDDSRRRCDNHAASRSDKYCGSSRGVRYRRGMCEDLGAWIRRRLRLKSAMVSA